MSQSLKDENEQTSQTNQDNHSLLQKRIQALQEKNEHLSEILEKLIDKRQALLEQIKSKYP